MINGVLLIDKAPGYTSRDIVNMVGKHFKTSKVGHTGTLDPLATGVLAITIGTGTKLGELLSSNEKEYIAEIMFGIATDTLDITGTLLKEENVSLNIDDVKGVLTSFIGSYEQEVPLYSAVKIKGKKLYEYARKGELVDLPKRKVTIQSLTLMSDIYEKDGHPAIRIQTLVSKGTYIRSLIRDIALRLGTIAVMSELRRIRQGCFSIENSVTIDALESAKCISIESCLSNYPRMVVDKKTEEKIYHGMLLANEYHEDFVLFMSEEGNVLSLYQVYEKDKTKLKPYKTFWQTK